MLYRSIKCIKRLGIKSSGFGLAETLIAVAILGISLTGFISSLSAGSIAADTQHEAAIVQRLAQTQMEIIKAADFDSSGKYKTSVETPEGYDLEINVENVDKNKENLQKITVIVNHEGQSVFTLEGMKSDR